jgi:hypothetical protein
VDTTEDLSLRFDAVGDDTAVEVGANRRQRVDCALEAVAGVALSAHDDFKPLSYSFSQPSHVGIHNSFAPEAVPAGV